MEDYFNFGQQLRSFLAGLTQQENTSIATTTRNLYHKEMEAKERRENPDNVPGSVHFASMLAYGEFIFADGSVIKCEAIPGMSGVITMEKSKQNAAGHPEVQLKRILTHFHFSKPNVLIEQHYAKESTGVLTGAVPGNIKNILPGKASFSQYLILTVDGISLANRDPLVMTAERVTEWPPIGSTFVLEKRTDFYEIDKLQDTGIKPRAALSACKAAVTQEFLMPLK